MICNECGYAMVTRERTNHYVSTCVNSKCYKAVSIPLGEVMERPDWLPKAPAP